MNKLFKEIDPALMSVEEVSARAFLMINEELKTMGANTESATDKIDQQSAAWENAKISAGKFLNTLKGFVAPALTKGLNALRIFFIAAGMPGGMTKLAENINLIKLADAEIARLAEEQAKADAIAAEEAAKATVAESERLRAVKASQKAYEDLGKTIKEASGMLYVAPGVDPGKQPEGDETPVNPFSVDSPFENYDITGPQIIATNEKVAESFKYASYSAEQFADALMGLGVYADSMEDFGKAAINAARQFVAAKLAEVVAQQIQNAVKSSGGNPYVALILGAAIGGATAAMFNSIVPKFGEGGVVNGPTLAMVGEKGPEAIIPLNKMGGTRITGELQLRGRDLYWSLKNYNDHLNRTT